MPNNLKISNVSVTFGSVTKNEQSRMGFILYEGDIDNFQDIDHIEIDTNKNEMNMVFIDGHKENIIDELSEDNISNVVDIHQEFAQSKNDVVIGLFRTENEAIDPKRACYVDTLVI